MQEYKTSLRYGPESNTTSMFVLEYKELNYSSIERRFGTSSTGFAVFLTRYPYPFFFNTYLPTELLTLISFIGFLVPVDVVPGRTALLVTIFLMLVNISNMVQSRGPVVRTVNFLMQTLLLKVCNSVSDQCSDNAGYLVAPLRDLCSLGSL